MGRTARDARATGTIGGVDRAASPIRPEPWWNRITPGFVG
jgi:hypothetical protein